MKNLTVDLIEAFDDNYIFFLECAKTGITAVVDPGDSAPVIDFLERTGKPLDQILVTHHHRDHVGGILELKRKYGCRVIGAKLDAERIPGIDLQVIENDQVNVGKVSFQILSFDGHTLGHIGYYAIQERTLFCGDTVFSLGCGKLFEGSAEQMWNSLTKVMRLPPETLIYCTHEYTLENGLFATALDPNNHELKTYLEECKKKRSRGAPTIPTTLASELKCNPFFRVNDTQISIVLGLTGHPPARRFGKIRNAKDNFDSGTNPFQSQ